MAKGMRAREERHVSEEYENGQNSNIGINDGAGGSDGPGTGDNGAGGDAGQTSDMVTGKESSADGVATKGRTEAEKAAAFSRLASIRASNAADAMRGLSHLANTKQYAFTSEQVDKMLGALSESVEALRKAFAVALEPPAPAEQNGLKKRQGRVNFSVRV